MPLRARGNHRRHVDRDAMREDHIERVSTYESSYHPRHLRPLDEKVVDDHHQVPREQIEAVRTWMESPRSTGEL